MTRRKYQPRSGSLGFKPLKRTKRETAKFRSWPSEKQVGLLGFIGFKAGMTHIIGIDGKKHTPTKGQEVRVPVTILDTPPMKCFGIRTYGNDDGKFVSLSEFLAPKVDKHLKRKITSIEKKKKTHDLSQLDKLVADGKVVEIRLLMHTQPVLTSTGHKKPHVTEIPIGGTLEEQVAFAKETLGKEVTVDQVFKPNDYLDAKAATKGKGMQGPVKRMGVKLQQRKAKHKRIMGTIGSWHPNAILWTVPRAGQMGYHNRMDLNKRVIKVGTKEESIVPAGGFLRYGNVNNAYLMLAGSVAGPTNRVVGLRKAIRPPRIDTVELSEITYISQASKQGV